MSISECAPVAQDEVGRVFQLVAESVAPRLRAAVERLPSTVRRVAGYHFGWLDEHGNPANGSAGKLLRPALALLCARAVGASADRAADAAVAVELVHNFSLLHDDVMDGDTTRRHQRTVWAVFGVPTAILAGDAMLVAAMELLASAPGSVSVLCMASQALVQGQGLDLAFEQRDDVSVEECLAMAGGKTAMLLRCACELGAAHGGGAPQRVRALGRFGWHLGLAFQLVDDLLGIWGDPAVTGKPALADLRARKKSLPVVAALASGASELATLYLRPDPLSDSEVVRVAALIERAGGRDWAQSEAERQLAEALDHLMSAAPEPGTAESLVAVAELIVRRDR